jgi:hypothetical protein
MRQITARSFIVRGKGNPASFHSCAHGAGRRMSRTHARHCFKEADLVAQTLGVECRKDRAVLDELPQAYKPMVLVSNKPKNTIILAGLIVMVMHFLQAGRKRATLPGTEEPMTTLDFITALFCQVDDHLPGIPKHPHATLWPSERVTLGLLHALKGGGNRAFYRWLTRDYHALFPQLPERTRLFRLFRTHHDWTQLFLAAPTVLGGIDTYGIELIHPMREGRSPQQIGRKGLSNHRWIVGNSVCC